MNAVRSNNVSLKYQRFTSSGCKDKRITKIEFVTKTQSFTFKEHIILKKLLIKSMVEFNICYHHFLDFFISCCLFRIFLEKKIKFKEVYGNRLEKNRVLQSITFFSLRVIFYFIFLFLNNGKFYIIICVTFFSKVL